MKEFAEPESISCLLEMMEASISNKGVSNYESLNIH